MAKENIVSRVFGIVSKKKLIEEMVDIYVENDTDSGIAMTYYSMGNANALNALSSRLGIDLTPYIQTHKELKQKGRKDGGKDE